MGDADGCAKHPQRFSPLTNSSSFEDFQPHLHGAASFPEYAQSLCTWASEAPLPIRPPVLGSCRTAVEGEECYKKVQ